MRKSLLSLIGISCFFISNSQIMYPGDVTVTGSKEVVFDYSADACNANMSMDGSANALRDANGKIILIVPNHTQFRITGTDFNSLSPDCATGTIFSSDSDPNKANFNYKEWLSVPYTTDGVNMYGLVHNEYHGYDFSGECGHADVLKCWYNGITSAYSTDSGKTFSHAAAPNHLVAAIPYQYDKDHGYRQGAFSPTNIIKHRSNGYYYAFFHTEAQGQQQDGLVAMRTQDITDPSSWRMYNGTDFSGQTLNPYTATGFDTTQYVFHVINGTKGVGGVYYSTYFEKYMMVFHSKYELGGTMTEGMCYALSDDLVTWGTKKMIYAVNQSVNSSTNNGSWDYGAYPSIIDHNDTTRNFDEIGQEAYLYYVKWNNTSNPGDPNRDLVRIPIKFSKNMVTGFTVTGTGNQEDANPGDGVCETPAGNCSFYAAIQESNARLVKHADTVLNIDFNNGSRFINATAGAGTIPGCQYPVNIDGTMNESATENTALINDTINTYLGVRIGLGGNPGLSFSGGNTTIKGICISYPLNAAIGFSGKGNNKVVGCFLGTSIAGTANQSETNDGWGVLVDNVPNVTIGGENAADRNLILGGIKVKGKNATGITIKGNFIGTDITGTLDLEQSEHGIGLSDSCSGVIIGGVNTEARNIISGNNRGINIEAGSGGHQIINNYVGTNMEANAVLSNTAAGISLASDGNTLKNNIIAGSGSGEAGIWLSGSNNTLQNNYFGTNSSNTDLGNLGAAIILHGGAANNTIGGYNSGEGNTFGHNDADGIATFGSAGVGNAFLGNSYYDNGEQGIDIGEDDLSLESDVPKITLASVVGDSLFATGTYTGTASSAYRIEFYWSDACDPSGFGEGKNYIGYLTTTSDANGSMSFGGSMHAPSLTAGKIVTCIPTNGSNTSHEFSKCFTAASGIPDIRFSDDTVEVTILKDNNGNTTLTLYNDGSADLTWSLTDKQNWHQAGTENGTISGGGSEAITLNVFGSGVASGVHYDTLTIVSNDPDETNQTVILKLTVEEPDIHANDTSDVYIQPNRTENRSFWLKNVGTGTLTFTAGHQLGGSILKNMSPKSGSIAEGDSLQVTFEVNTNGKSVGTYKEYMWVSSNDPDENVIEVWMRIHVDATVSAFNLNNDQVLISKSNNMINITGLTAVNKDLQRITISDELGRTVYQIENPSQNEYQIKVDNRIHFINLYSNRGVSTKKVK